jgi:type I restriction enzyme S subunit
MAGEWIEEPFPEVIDFQEGPGIMARDFRDEGIPLVRLSGLDRGGSVLSGCNYLDPAMVAGKWAHFALAKGDILLSTSASLGRIAVVGEDAVGAIAYTGIIRMRPRDGRLIAPFIRYLLEGPDFQQQAEMVGVGSVIRHFGPMHLRQMSVKLPPPDEQRAIAHILGTLDDKIELNRRMSETLEAMARALFKSWFVDFDPVRAKSEGRDPGLPQPLADLFPDSFEDSELGEIPRGWVVATLGELIDTIKGRSYRSEELIESDTALVTLKSFARGGGYRPDGLKSFAGTFKPEQVVEPGELVIACTDVTQAAEVIGRPAIVRGTGVYRRLVASLDTLIVRPRGSSMTRSFLYFLAGTEAFVAHTFAHTTGTTVLHLAKEAVPSFMFARPSTELVKQFDALAGLVLDRIQALEEESVTLAALRDALLPKLISGELRVRDAEKVVARAGP